MHHSSDLAPTMVNQHRKRLSIILSPSPPMFATPYVQSRTVLLDPVPISHREDSRRNAVTSQSQSLDLPSSIPVMFPPLSGLTTSDLSPTVSWTSNGSEPSVTRPPLGGPSHIGDSPTSHGPHSRHRTTSDREKQACRTLSPVEPTFPSPASASRPSNEGTSGRIQVKEPPKPKRPSEDSSLSRPALSPDIQRSPRTSRNRLKRRISVDVTSTLDRITLAGGIEPKQVTLSRSRSLWTSKRMSATVEDDAEDGETRLTQVNSLPEPLAEKQRVMNVRRAKKMQQVFGLEPPRALFQIAHVNPTQNGEHGQGEGPDTPASASTLLSIQTSNLLSPQPLSSSSMITAPASPLTPTTPILPQPETPTSVLPRFEQSFTHNSSETPPPFSSMFPASARTPAATQDTSKSIARTETTGRHREKDFQQRRVRAAKLSKFFGVGYQDLEPHLAPKKSRTGVRKLEVAIDARSGLFRDRHEVRNLEMQDVIVRLRDLRSS